MTDNSILRSWNGRTIRQRADGYFSLTDMATACEKRYSDWETLVSTKSYLDKYISNNQHTSNTHSPIEVVKDGAMEGRGTWGHRRVALRFAQWCSDDFAVQVDIWIEELLTTGKVELTQPKPQTQAEIILASAQLLVEIERRQLALEADNQALKAKTEHHDEKLEAQEKWLEGIDAELDRLESPDGHYFSVIGYGNLNNLAIGHQLSISLGKKCSAYCRKNGLRKEFVGDSMYGKVGIYPPECLEFVFVSEGLITAK